ncbi:MAG: oligosaccharide flippase family protein [Tissierellia bacterium]|nr:oligosaccharide flippase family protein [Tissierellia bacterium]
MNQLKVGALLSYVNMALHILMGLVYVPLLLHYLSVEEYGLYQLIGSLVAYLSVMDFGLSGTITRYYSQRLALDDKKGQENVLAIAIIIYLGIGVLVVIAGIVMYQLLDTIYGSTLSTQEMVSAKSMMILLVINVALTIPSNVFTSAITSHERFVFLRLVTIIKSILNPVVVLAVLQFKAEALSVVQVQVALNIVVILCNIWYARQRIRIKIQFHDFDKPLIKAMFVFSFFIFLNGIVDQVYWKTGQLILGAVSGTAAVAVFSIAIQLSQFYVQFSTGINSVFLPRLSKLAAISEDMREINTMFIKVGRIQYSLLGLIFTGFILFGRRFLSLWVGEALSEAYRMTLVIMIPLTIPLIQNLGILILQAKNKHAFRSIVYAIIAVVNVAISIPLAKRYGGLGCAIATSGCLFLGNGVIINMYYYRIGIDVIQFFKEIARLSLPVFLAGAGGYFFVGAFPMNGWDSFLIGVLLYSGLYILLLWFFGLNQYEKQLIQSMVKRVQ